MTPENLVRVGGGLAAIAGGVLGVIASLIALVALLPALLTGGRPLGDVYASGIYTLDVLLFLGAWILALGGLVALYASQWEAAGVLGVVSFLIAFLGTVFLVGVLWGELFYTPVLAKVVPQSIPVVLSALRMVVGGGSGTDSRFGGLDPVRGGYFEGPHLPTCRGRDSHSWRGHQRFISSSRGRAYRSSCSHSLVRLPPLPRRGWRSRGACAYEVSYR